MIYLKTKLVFLFKKVQQCVVTFSIYRYVLLYQPS